MEAVGWSETSHAKGVDGQADLVLPEDAVPRLDISICDARWQVMVDDLDALYGDMDGGPGGGGPGGGGPGGEPPEALADPVYVPVDVSFDDRTWPSVGMRFKGNSSLMQAYMEGSGKLPFRLEFDQFEDDIPEIEDQRFWGFKVLKFSSGFKDDSLIRDKATAETFRDAGVPAARGGFMRVYVDVGDGPVFWGLYTAFEDPAGEMLDDWFGGDSGNAYKPEGGPAQLMEFDATGFEKKTNEAEDDFGDVEAFVDALNADRSDAEAWREGLEATFEVDAFLRYLALNNLLENWDSYGNMSHNYYLYGDPEEDGRLVWIPWDFNMSYGWEGHAAPLTLGMDEVDDDWPLIRYLADDPVYRERYLEHMAEMVETPFELETQRQRMTRYHDLVEPYALEEQEPYTTLSSTAAFEGSLEEILFPQVEEMHEAAEELLAE